MSEVNSNSTKKQFFSELSIRPSKIFLKSLNDFLTTDIIWEEKFYFTRVGIPQSILKLDNNLSNMVIDLNIGPRAGIFKFSPRSSCQWHTDTSRMCSINMLISGTNSHCFFGKCRNISIYDDITELKYKKNRLYAFNTSEPHMVINYNDVRYLLTLGIPPPFTYTDLINYLKNKNFLHENRNRLLQSK